MGNALPIGGFFMPNGNGQIKCRQCQEYGIPRVIKKGNQLLAYCQDCNCYIRCVRNNKRYRRLLKDPQPSHPSWVDYNSYLKSTEWQQQRRKALSYAENRCQICNHQGKAALHVHHRSYERIGNENPEDLTVLCSRCHALFHQHTYRKNRKFSFVGMGTTGAEEA
jgi:5-methylcytosine-specific restriction endonuclease McrA